MAWVFNPWTGSLDFSGTSGGVVIPDFAAALKVTRICDEPIATGEVVTAISPTRIALATQNDTLEKAQVFGLAAESGDTDDSILVLLLGVFSDPSYSVFSLNDPLVLDIDGAIRNDKPSSGFLTSIGKSLGGTEILFQAQPPVLLGG